MRIFKIKNNVKVKGREMKDYLVKALAFNGEVRAYAVRSTEVVKKAQELFNSYPTATAALGRTLSIASLMGAMLKGDDDLTIRIDGGGPINGIVVRANANGEVSGYMGNPGVHFQYNSGKLNVGMAVGAAGHIQVTKDLGLKNMFTTTSEIVSGEIAEDFTHYFLQSEQIPSSVGAGVLVDVDNKPISAGAFIIQVMPNVKEETIVEIEKRLEKITPISTMIQEGATPEEILNTLLGSENVQIVDKHDVTYKCNCSKERFERGIIALGEKEISKIFEENNNEVIETECHFCLKKYTYSKEDLNLIK